MELALVTNDLTFDFVEKCMPMVDATTFYFSLKLDGTWDEVEGCTLELWAESLGPRP